MSLKEITVGSVKVVRHGTVVRQSPILVHCSGYGMTCGELGTTNGYINMVARLLVGNADAVVDERNELDDPTYDFLIELDGQKRSLTSDDFDCLAKEMRYIYHRVMNAEKIRDAHVARWAQHLKSK